MQSARPPAPPAEGAFDAPEAPALRCPSCGAPASEGDRACAHCGSLLSTRRCVACFALSPRDAEKCVRCGALLPAEALKPSSGTCPDCKAAFVARQAGVAGFSECPRCGGLFLTRESFDAVVKDAATRERARALDEAAEHIEGEHGFHYRPCPVCRRFMNRSNFGGGSGVILDVCGPHGVFLDRGELTRVVDFIEKGGWEKVKKREIQRMEEEAIALESRKRGAADLSLGSPAGESGEALSKIIRAIGEFLIWW